MISLDIETSGLFPEQCGIWQIGAVDIDNPNYTFLEEARIDYEDKVFEGALTVGGKTVEELRDLRKQTQKEMLKHFFDWTKKVKVKNIISQNPAVLDYPLPLIKARQYDLDVKKFPYRVFDLHSIAQVRYYQLNGRFLIEDGRSSMDLKNVLQFCGIPDDRMKVEGNRIIKIGRPHNALEDAELTAECFSRLVYEKGLFPEYSQYEIPKVLVGVGE